MNSNVHHDAPHDAHEHHEAPRDLAGAVTRAAVHAMAHDRAGAACW